MTASCRSGRAVAIGHGGAEHLADLERLRREHRGLVGQADPAEVLVGVEPVGHRAPEPLEKRRPRTAMADVIADDLRFRAVEDDQVPAVPILQRL